MFIMIKIINWLMDWSVCGYKIMVDSVKIIKSVLIH